MTVNGQTKDATFWVENASVDWPEAQAPFYSVGRLTLQPKSLLPDEECQARFIDVTKFSLPDHRPLGSINRARWVAESASRKARLSGAAAAPAARPSLVQRLGAITLGTVAKSLAVVAAGFALLLGMPCRVPDRADQPRRRHAARRLDRSRRLCRPGLGRRASKRAERQTYYYTAQGAVLKDVRYSWFRNLEMPWSTTKLSDPQIMRRYGFLVDGPSPQNPDGLPVGFAKHYDQQLNEEMLDITCAACHTGADPGHAQRPDDGAAHRRRIGAARVHQLEHRPLRADAGRVAAGHAGQSDEVQPLRERGPRPEPRGRTLGAAAADAVGRGAVRVDGLQREGVRTRSDRGRLRPDRRARADRQHRLRRSPRGAELRRRERAGQLSAGLEHLEVRLGAVQRVGEPADGAQYRRGDGHRREVRAGRSLRQRRCRPTSASARRPSWATSTRSRRRCGSCSRRRGTRTCSDRSIGRRPRAARTCSTSTASRATGRSSRPPTSRRATHR